METSELSYSQAMARLSEILERIEKGEADIDELSGLVKEAAELVELCRRKLSQAEMEVKTITERLERETEEPPATQEPPSGETEEEVPF